MKGHKCNTGFENSILIIIFGNCGVIVNFLLIQKSWIFLNFTRFSLKFFVCFCCCCFHKKMDCLMMETQLSKMSFMFYYPSLGVDMISLLNMLDISEYTCGEDTNVLLSIHYKSYNKNK